MAVTREPSEGARRADLVRRVANAAGLGPVHPAWRLSLPPRAAVPNVARANAVHPHTLWRWVQACRGKEESRWAKILEPLVSRANTGNRKLWQAMRILTGGSGFFTISQLASVTESSRRAASNYVLRLAAVGYIRRRGTNRRATWRLLSYTGPHAPRLLRDGGVYDANQGVILRAVAS